MEKEFLFVNALRAAAFDYYSKYYEYLAKVEPQKFDESVIDEVCGFRVTQTLAILTNFFNSFDPQDAINAGEPDMALLVELFGRGFQSAYESDLQLYANGLGDSDFNGIC